MERANFDQPEQPNELPAEDEAKDVAVEDLDWAALAEHDEADEKDSSPAERVVAFLECNRSIFGAVDEAWRSVHEFQEEATGVYDALLYNNDGSNREKQRYIARKFRDMMNPNGRLGAVRGTIGMSYARFASANDMAGDVAGLGQSFVAYLAEERKDENDALGYLSEIYQHDDTDSESPISTFFQNLAYASTEIKLSGLRALFYQDVALRRLGNFLQDEEVIEPFFDFLQDAASSGPHAEQIVPGLLSLLATHIAEAGQEHNVLRDALRQSAPGAADMAGDFLANTELKGIPKELHTALACLKIVQTMLAREGVMEADEFIAAFAAEHAEWPAALTKQLEARTAAYVIHRWNSLWKSLEPFVRKGRLDIRVHGMQAGMRPPRLPKLRRSSFRSSSRGVVEVEEPFSTYEEQQQIKALTVSETRDFTDVYVETDKSPIKQFAMLRAVKGTQRFEVEKVPDIDALMDSTNINDFIKRHAQDKTLEPLIRKALQELTRNPNNPIYTHRYGGVKYELVSEGAPRGPRSPRRFSLQRMTGRGKVAEYTRIIYDTAWIDGERTLIVYAAFLKPDIENIGRSGGGLPLIRR